MLKYNKTIIFMIVLSMIIGYHTSVVVGARGYQNNNDAVLLKDVTVLTLQNNMYTKAGRTSPIKQLECVGGSARRESSLYPSTVQCTNMGSDGIDVQWECRAQLDSSVKLGRVSVSCEGYTYPEDPYILRGSCGLTYELEYSDPVQRQKYSDDDSSFFTYFIWFLVIAFVLYVIFSPPTGGNQYGGGVGQQPPPGYGNQYGNGGNPPPNYPPGGYGGGYGAGGGYGGAPYGGGYGGGNPYMGGCQPPGAGMGYGGWRPGFWSGAGLGYLFGRNTGGHNNYHNTYTAPRTSSWGRSGGGATGVSMSSSSYSGTTRR